MARLDNIRSRSTWRDMIEGQPQHLGLIVLLTAGTFALLRPCETNTTLLGLTTIGWAMLSVWLAVAHQVVVALVFRLQLHRGILSRWLGEEDMRLWTMVFVPFLILRPVTVILTGWADEVPIGLPRMLEWGAGLILISVAIYTMHSVLVYFTIPRAVGGDHFRDEIARLPLVREGAFKYTRNAMYGIVFLGLWGIALAFGSWNALVLALFQHVYIWVHMYCTERPDMEWIYAGR